MKTLYFFALFSLSTYAQQIATIQHVTSPAITWIDNELYFFRGKHLYAYDPKTAVDRQTPYELHGATALAYDETNKNFITGHENGKVTLLNPETQKLKEVTIDGSPITHIEKKASSILIQTKAGTVKVFDTRTYKPIANESHTHTKASTLSPDGKKLFISYITQEGVGRIINLSDKTVIQKEKPFDPIVSASWGPESLRLGHAQGTIRSTDSKLKLLNKYQLTQSVPISHIDHNPSNRSYLATTETTLYVQNGRDTLLKQELPVIDLALWSTDGKKIATMHTRAGKISLISVTE